MSAFLKLSLDIGRVLDGPITSGPFAVGLCSSVAAVELHVSACSELCLAAFEAPGEPFLWFSSQLLWLLVNTAALLRGTKLQSKFASSLLVDHDHNQTHLLPE